MQSFGEGLADKTPALATGVADIAGAVTAGASLDEHASDDPTYEDETDAQDDQAAANDLAVDDPPAIDPAADWTAAKHGLWMAEFSKYTFHKAENMHDLATVLSNDAYEPNCPAFLMMGANGFQTDFISSLKVLADMVPSMDKMTATCVLTNMMKEPSSGNQRIAREPGVGENLSQPSVPTTPLVRMLLLSIHRNQILMNSFTYMTHLLPSIIISLHT